MHSAQSRKKGSAMDADESGRPGYVNLALGICAGIATAVVFGIGGFLIVYNSDGYMGWTLFFLVPVFTGFATALVARGLNILSASLILGLLFCTGILLVTRFEGFVCVLISTPFVAAGLAIGSAVGWAARVTFISKFGSSKTLTLLLMLIAPMFLLGANRTERSLTSGLRTEMIADTVYVDAPPEAVWHELASMESISATKTFL